MAVTKGTTWSRSRQQLSLVFTASIALGLEQIIATGFQKLSSKHNNNFPEKIILLQNRGLSKAQSNCLLQTTVVYQRIRVGCRKPKSFYFGSFSLDDPDCGCYNNNTSMFNSLQCSDKASDSHTQSVRLCEYLNAIVTNKGRNSRNHWAVRYKYIKQLFQYISFH